MRPLCFLNWGEENAWNSSLEAAAHRVAQTVARLGGQDMECLLLVVQTAMDALADCEKSDEVSAKPSKWLSQLTWRGMGGSCESFALMRMTVGGAAEMEKMLLQSPHHRTW